MRRSDFSDRRIAFERSSSLPVSHFRAFLHAGRVCNLRVNPPLTMRWEKLAGSKRRGLAFAKTPVSGGRVA